MRAFDNFLWLGLLLSALLLLAGWTLPLLTVETFFVFEDQLTIVGALAQLRDSGEHALYALVGLFTVVFPLVKLVLALFVWWRLKAGDRRLVRFVGWLELIGKWSMLDVFVVAILVVVIKVSLVSDVTLHAGLYVFAGAVLLSMTAVARLMALARRAAQEERLTPD